MGTLGQDLKYALRNLGKAPGFSAVSVIALALGIGASTAIFSIIDNIMFEPFPYPDAERFTSVQIHDTERNEPGGRGAFSGPEFLDYVEQNHAFDRVIANAGLDVLYRAGEGTLRYDGPMSRQERLSFWECSPCAMREYPGAKSPRTNFLRSSGFACAQTACASR